MNKRTLKRRSRHLKYDGFFIVAFWQLMLFFMLILVVWANEMLDLSSLWFDIRSENPNFYRGCALSISIIIIAIVTVGQTFLQQKRIIKGLVVVCSGCRKMRVDTKVWAHLDHYLQDNSLAKISHGLCPDCYKHEKQIVDDFVKDSPKPLPIT